MLYFGIIYTLAYLHISTLACFMSINSKSPSLYPHIAYDASETGSIY